MPATRSRTEHWKESLHQVLQRGGALEICVNREVSPDGTAPASEPFPEGRLPDVAWRVRLLAIEKDRLVVETPSAFGANLKLQPGTPLIGSMSIGQNRWMFHTRALGYSPATGENGTKIARSDGRLLLGLPQQVERCSRRSFFRISTANLNLPIVHGWALNDPSSVIPAEAENRARIQTAYQNRGQLQNLSTEPLMNPDVGAKFTARLLNMSGGGLGLVVDRENHSAATSRPFLWLNIDLRPDIPVPVAVTARIAHQHIDSAQNLYLGLAFDSTYDPQHQQFVSNLFAKYVDLVQAAGSLREAA